MSDFNSLTASELGDMIGLGKVDPVELTEHFLSQIKASPIAEKIYSTITPELAKEQAIDAKRRANLGRRLSSLDGVPISWKDLYDIKGLPCEAGSGLLVGRIANSLSITSMNRNGERGQPCLIPECCFLHDDLSSPFSTLNVGFL